MRFILASNNSAKTKEIQILATQMGHEIINYRELLGEKLSFPQETTTSQTQNATTKAAFIHEFLPNEIILADDTALYLKAFPQRFGVVTAREFVEKGIIGTEAEQQYILNLYQNNVDRAGYLLAVMALVTPDGQTLLAKGQGGIRVADNIRRGQWLDGLDNIMEAENGKTLSEMTLAEVIQYHDRSRALQTLINKI